MSHDNLILHIDADAFFVACEVARMPELKGKPVVVGGERGIACAMSYEAKSLGVTRAMPVFQIKKLFPQTIILPAHFDLYYAYQKNLSHILREQFSHVEVYSIDECFISIPKNSFPRNESDLRALQEKLYASIGISYSLGLARTKTLAKIASKKNKPHGVFHLTEEREKSVLRETKLSSVWGIGRESSAKLERLSLYTAEDFVNYDITLLGNNFSLPLLRTHAELSGSQKIKIEDVKKDQDSMQITRSFQMTDDISFVLSELSFNIEKLVRNLQKDSLLTQKISVFIKRKLGSEHIYITEKFTLERKTNDLPTTMKTLSPFFESVRKYPYTDYKGTGVHAHDLTKENEVQLDLFGIQETIGKETASALAATLQEINSSATPLILASSLLSEQKRKRDRKREDRESFYSGGLPYPYLGVAS